MYLSTKSRQGTGIGQYTKVVSRQKIIIWEKNQIIPLPSYYMFLIHVTKKSHGNDTQSPWSGTHTSLKPLPKGSHVYWNWKVPVFTQDISSEKYWNWRIKKQINVVFTQDIFSEMYWNWRVPTNECCFTQDISSEMYWNLRVPRNECCFTPQDIS